MVAPPCKGSPASVVILGHGAFPGPGNGYPRLLNSVAERQYGPAVRPQNEITRRRLVATTGAGIGSALAGCLGSGGDSAAETPDPVDLSGGKQDDQGGMVIGEHAGPNGQIFYQNNSPDGHDNPAWFHSLVGGLFPYHFEKERHDWDTAAVYVTDYSLVEYELTTQNGQTFISSHTAPESFAPAREVRYVAGSDARGGMGKELIPFSDEGDVTEFTSDYGGDMVEFEDVDADFVQEYRRR